AVGRGIEGIAADAVKRRAPSLEFEAPVIAPVVPQPEREKHESDERTVDDGAGGEVEHADHGGGGPAGRRPALPQRKKKRRLLGARGGYFCSPAGFGASAAGAASAAGWAGASAGSAFGALALPPVFRPFALRLPFDFL